MFIQRNALTANTTATKGRNYGVLFFSPCHARLRDRLAELGYSEADFNATSLL